MPTIDESEGRLALLASGFRLVFRWLDDRWTHALELDDGSSETSLASSIEGAADPSRLVSPAFQQIHALRPADDPEAVRALLLGQVGPHHTSAAFTLRESNSGVLVSVEVADRCRSEIVALASTYAVDLPPGNLRAADPSSIRWDLSPGSLSLCFEAAPPARVGLREAGRRGVQVQAAALVSPGESTFTWSYSWMAERSR
ncbi:hypothetical protein [Tautonia sociabilis]|uniref:Uncharacterized protein n=1 Tax=Tautonia sociabilis TaxID=2080755 RepID=A0A432MR02_9BACT|nr:hypothetical protein [Tautonia sociabilis]RUL89689.1 hypothetical protein TsocGM_00525 [Tautonia sociabilis]